MDLELITTSLPKLLSAAVVTPLPNQALFAVVTARAARAASILHHAGTLLCLRR